jgi:hypothetical protein
VILTPGQLVDQTSEGQRVRIARPASGPGTPSP